MYPFQGWCITLLNVLTITLIILGTLSMTLLTSQIVVSGPINDHTNDLWDPISDPANNPTHDPNDHWHPTNDPTNDPRDPRDMNARY